jgi:hypothetical protein
MYADSERFDWFGRPNTHGAGKVHATPAWIKATRAARDAVPLEVQY